MPRWFLLALFFSMISLAPLGCGDTLSPTEPALEKQGERLQVGEFVKVETSPTQEPPLEQLAPTESEAGEHPSDAGLPQEVSRDAGGEPLTEGQRESLSPEPPPPESIRSEPPPSEQTNLPPLQAKAVSLRASFLGDDLQRGLMERDRTAAHLWSLTWVLPQGSHRFSFVLDGKGSHYGTNGSISGTTRGGALAVSRTPLTLTLTAPARATFSVDLQARRWRMTLAPKPTNARMIGSWNGLTHQTRMLSPSPDGTYSTQLSLKAGACKWQFVLAGAGPGGSNLTLGAIHVAHGAFPQGGPLKVGGDPLFAQIPEAQQVQITLDPLAYRFTLRPLPTDGVKAWGQLYQALTPISSSTQRAALLKQFLATRQRQGMLPLQHGGEVVFVTEWASATKVYVAGSFNQWSTTATPMKQIAGTAYFYLQMTLPSGHHEYKFVDNATPPHWRLDPLNPAITYGSFGPNSTLHVGAPQRSLLHWHQKVQATALKNTRDVFVYLPPGYDPNGQARYPVLYMHDGQNLFDPKAIFGGWDVGGWMDKLIAQGKVKPAIIVGAANTPGRMDEYTQTQDKIGGRLVGGKARQYADFLIRDLKPWIDGRYKTLPDHRNTGTMGSSLGGLVSLWLGLQYPEVFFRIGALSSTFGWGKLGAQNPTILDHVQSMNWRDLIIYLDSGSPKDNYKETIQMRNLLEQKGYIHGLNLRHWTEQGADHNEIEWRKRLHRPLTFLLSW